MSFLVWKNLLNNGSRSRRLTCKIWLQPYWYEWREFFCYQAFFSEHPEFANNDFYITGESYAGHYIPAFAARVHKGNKAKEGIPINLKACCFCYLYLIMSCICLFNFYWSQVKMLNRDLPLAMGLLILQSSMELILIMHWRWI